MLQKVLIVDDCEVIHALIRSRLGDEPVVIRSAYDAHGAINAARLWRPDVVLLDASLPDADGFAVCRALQEDPMTLQAAIVFVSAACEIEDKVRALEMGASDYITKPFNGPEFKARIRAILRIQARLSLLAANRVRAFMTESYGVRAAA